jgi:alkyl sulfatase BDS1-like metallo-beta-lactamase superfamily hydrolase
MSMSLTRKCAIELDARGKINMVLRMAYEQSLISKEIFKKKEEWLKVPDNTPNWLKAKINGYWDGAFDYFRYMHIQFYYSVNNQFYTIRKEEKEFPYWDTLPREQWSQLGDCGGLYYKHSMKPYYISEKENA